MYLYVLLKQDTGLAKNVLLGKKVRPGLATGQQTLATPSPLPIQVHCARPLTESGVSPLSLPPLIPGMAVEESRDDC